jgi:hypothetical protein
MCVIIAEIHSLADVWVAFANAIEKKTLPFMELKDQLT